MKPQCFLISALPSATAVQDLAWWKHQWTHPEKTCFHRFCEDFLDAWHWLQNESKNIRTFYDRWGSNPKNFCPGYGDLCRSHWGKKSRCINMLFRLPLPIRGMAPVQVQRWKKPLPGGKWKRSMKKWFMLKPHLFFRWSQAMSIIKGIGRTGRSTSGVKSILNEEWNVFFQLDIHCNSRIHNYCILHSNFCISAISTIPGNWLFFRTSEFLYGRSLLPARLLPEIRQPVMSWKVWFDNRALRKGSGSSWSPAK